MKLSPVRATTKPSYPAHRRHTNGLGTWARRAAAVGFTSCALALGGCYGASPYERDDPPTEDIDDDDDDETVDDTVEVDTTVPHETVEIPPVSPVPDNMAGGAMAPGFECDAPPEWTEFRAPAYMEGSLCGEETSWARLIVDTPSALVASFESGYEYATVAIVAPHGSEVAEAGPELTRVDLHLPAGEYLLAATALDPINNGYVWFALRIDPA